MAVKDMETVTDDQINSFEQACRQVSSKAATQEYSKVSSQALSIFCDSNKNLEHSKIGCDNIMPVENQQSIEDKVVEINAIAPVVRGLWKSVSHSSKTIYVQEVSQDHDSEIQVEESSEDEDEEEELDVAIVEMKQLIKFQRVSQASKYQQIIRESDEFSKEDLEDGSENYESLKCEVIHILQKKIDKKNYKNAIKQCRKTAINASEDWYVGDSRRPLKNALKKVRQSN